jgi:hypothetical protein
MSSNDVQRYSLADIDRYRNVAIEIRHRDSIKYDAIVAMLKSVFKDVVVIVAGGGGGGGGKWNATSSGFRGVGGSSRGGYQLGGSGSGGHRRPHSHVAHHHHHHQNHHSSKPSSTHVRRATPLLGSTPDRVVTCALNKLSTNNASRVVASIIDVLREKSIPTSDVAHAIIVKGTTDGSFLSLYVDLLTKLISVDTEIKVSIDRFLDDILGRDDHGSPRILEDIMTVAKGMAGISTAEYDGFCAALKAKSLLVNRHRLAIELDTEYRCIVIDVLEELLKKPVDTGDIDMVIGGTGEHVCDAALDITLEMVMQVLPKNATIASKVKDCIRYIDLSAYSAKIRFKLQDVCDWTKSNNNNTPAPPSSSSHKTQAQPYRYRK